jgi:hypothetical protein
MTRRGGGCIFKGLEAEWPIRSEKVPMINKYMPMYHEEDEVKTMKPIGEMMNLFGQSVPVDRKGRPLSERAHLVRYFVEHAKDKKGPLQASRVGFMLSHLSKGDLYAFKSILESETSRPWPEEAGPRPSQNDRWNRIFWARLRVEE